MFASVVMFFNRRAPVLRCFATITPVPPVPFLHVPTLSIHAPSTVLHSFLLFAYHNMLSQPLWHLHGPLCTPSPTLGSTRRDSGWGRWTGWHGRVKAGAPDIVPPAPPLDSRNDNVPVILKIDHLMGHMLESSHHGTYKEIVTACQYSLLRLRNVCDHFIGMPDGEDRGGYGLWCQETSSVGPDAALRPGQSRERLWEQHQRICWDMQTVLCVAVSCTAPNNTPNKADCEMWKRFVSLHGTCFVFCCGSNSTEGAIQSTVSGLCALSLQVPLSMGTSSGPPKGGGCSLCAVPFSRLPSQHRRAPAVQYTSICSLCCGVHFSSRFREHLQLSDPPAVEVG